MSTEECKFCDETDNLEKHHIVPRRFEGSDEEQNLVKVCPSCHRKLEELYDRSFYESIGAVSGSRISNRRGSGFFIVYCGVCDSEFVEHIPTTTGNLTCNVCGSDGKICVRSKINEKFAELVHLDNFLEEKERRSYYIRFEYTQKHSGLNRGVIFPRGSDQPISFSDRLEAYEKAQTMMLKDWCKSASIITVEHVAEVEEESIIDVFEDEGAQITRLEDKVLSALKSLDSQFEERNAFSLTKICNQLETYESKVSNILDSLCKQGLVFKPVEDAYQPVYADKNCT